MKYSVSMNLCRKIFDYKGDLCCFFFPCHIYCFSRFLFLCPYSPRLCRGHRVFVLSIHANFYRSILRSTYGSKLIFEPHHKKTCLWGL